MLDPPLLLETLRPTDRELIDAGRDLLTRAEPEDLIWLPPPPRDDRIPEEADDLTAAWLLPPPPLDLPPPPGAFFAIRGSANNSKAKVNVRKIILTCFWHFSVNMAYLLSFPSQTLTKQPYSGPPSVEGTNLRSGNTVFTSRSLSFQPDQTALEPHSAKKAVAGWRHEGKQQAGVTRKPALPPRR